MDGYSWIALLTLIVTVVAVWMIRKPKEYKYSMLDTSGVILNTVLIVMIYPPLSVVGALFEIGRFATEPLSIFLESATITMFCRADHFCVSGRCCRSVELHTELVEFSVSALLRLFITERCYFVICFYGKSTCEKSVFNAKSDCRCCSFGTESKGTFAFVCECVHFLLYDICSIANTSLEKLGFFECWESYFFVSC